MWKSHANSKRQLECVAIELTAPCCAQVHYRQAAPSPPGRCFLVPPKSWWWGKRACVHMHTSTISSFSVLWENKLTSNFLLNWFLLLWPLRKALGAKWWDIHWYQRKREWYWGFPVQPEAQGPGKHPSKEGWIFASMQHQSHSPNNLTSPAP